MAKSFKLVLDKIFDHLNKLKRPIANSRKAGVDSIEIENSLKEINLDCPPELLELYSCNDAYLSNDDDTIDAISFFPGYYWLDWNDSLTAYRSISQDPRWCIDWFPVFASGGGDFYAVICRSNSEDFGAVVGFLIGEDDHIVEFPDLSAMINTIEQSYEQGAFFVSEGYLEADYKRMRDISRLCSPNFEEHDA